MVDCRGVAVLAGELPADSSLGDLRDYVTTDEARKKWSATVTLNSRDLLYRVLIPLPDIAAMLFFQLVLTRTQ